MDYFVEIVKATAWPTSIIWLGYMFREEVRLLLGRLSSMKYGEVEARFGKELAEAEVGAQKLGIPKSESTQLNLKQKEQLFRIAEVSPRAAIVEAWTLIETAAAKKGLTSGTTIPRTNPKMIVEYLNSSGKFSAESLGLIEQLRRIRNQASHLPDFAITQNEAERYLELAAQSASVIESS
ncbi:MAG: hypothetical protein ING36_14005 [Burkholderiales bacterium]|jgi:hypothetical protein|nr:hypothetical protein [Microcystis sp. M015S1]MCA3176622.1 hypothetical protein [Burkholderiales bacterium]